MDLLDRTPTIDNGSTSGEQPVSHLETKDIESRSFRRKNFDGHLEFNEVDFVYPNRPESIVLKNFNLKIRAGTFTHPHPPPPSSISV